MAWSLPRTLRRLGADLVHTQYAAPLRCPCPFVVTVHDVSFARDPDFMSWKDRTIFRRVVPRAVRKAARVLTVSERTKADIVELYGIPAQRIVVTPNGVDPVFAAGSGAHDYVLSVGAIQRRKNQLAALEAAEAAGLPLVVVGPAKDPELAEELRRRGARLEGYVATERLAELYRGAACLVQSSRYEGFGLPVARGHGIRNSGRRRAGSGLARGGGGCRDLRRGGRAGRRNPPSDRASGIGSSRRGSNVRAPSAGARLRSGRSPCTGRYSGREGLRGRRLPRPCGRARALAARARPAGRRDARDREPSGLGSRGLGGCAHSREPASAHVRGQRQPRNRLHCG